ncbi:hypothetical protein KP509_33G019800 [Ceratopteris richardii]|nr:hypothetical protein KP509_33G019800 [Ceratopteris richardii]
MNEPTLIDYTEIEQAKKASPHWLSTNYIDLHLRSSRLVSSEAKGALRRHFEQPTKNEEEAAGAEAEERSVPSGGGIPWLMMLDDRSFLDEAFC